MADTNPRTQLAAILAAQAKLYGQVDNATWFARRIAEYRKAGQHQLADSTAEIARRHGVNLGEANAPQLMRRQAS